MTKQKPLIVGIDPGNTSAVAAIDLKGEIQLLESGRHFSPDQIIQTIIKVGKPVIITTDKQKIPSKVEKIANNLGTHKHTPSKDLSQEKKQKLGMGANNHELDAVAAAKNAYNQHQKQINKIEKYNKKINLDKATIAKKYFNGKPLTQIKKEDQRTEKTREEHKETEKIQEKQQEKSKHQKILQRKERKIENLKEQLEQKQKDLENTRNEKQDYKEKYVREKENNKKEVLKEQEISKKDAKIKEKNQRITELKKQLTQTQKQNKKYREAIEKIYKQNYQILPIEEKTQKQEDIKTVTEKQENAKKPETYQIDNLQGIKLEKYFISSEEPEEDLEKILNKYK